MSIKSSSRLSTAHVSDSSRPSLQKSAKPGGLNVKPLAGSAASLLWPGRASAVFRTVKTGYKVPRYQNSYRLSSYNPFNCEIVENILDDVMKTTLTGLKYNPAVCMKLCQDMSAEVRSRIHKKAFDRDEFGAICDVHKRNLHENKVKFDWKKISEKFYIQRKSTEPILRRTNTS